MTKGELPSRDLRRDVRAAYIKYNNNDNDDDYDDDDNNINNNK